MENNYIKSHDNRKLTKRWGRKAMGLREGNSYDCQVAERFVPTGIYYVEENFCSPGHLSIDGLF